MITVEALFKITYGLYIVCAGDKSKGNGFVSNTFFQVTSEPPQFSVCCNKKNLTCEMIESHRWFSVSILNQEADMELIKRFGYKSGRDIDKLAGMNLKYGHNDVPIVLDGAIAYLECTVVNTIDVGTHILFIGELVEAQLLDAKLEPLTYSYYRNVKKGSAPQNAPTYIDKSKFKTEAMDDQKNEFECGVCGYVYDEKEEELLFENLPDDWVCPVCGADKSEFSKL